MSIIKFNFQQKSKIKLLSPSFLQSEIADENIGKTKKDFIPLQIIRKDEFGMTLKVKSKINNKIYAMKILKKENQNEIREIIFLIRLKHQNIVKYYTNFIDNINYYIILEYVNGQTLNQLNNSYKIQKKQNEEKKIWNILDQCLRTIIYIHRQGIIHRNIKDSNIMLDENNKIKFIDFNSSAFMDIFSSNVNGHNYESMINSGTKIANEMGAPEISKGNYNAKVDVYSLGNIFFKFCDNKMNKYSDTLLSIINKMRIENPDQRSTINEIYEKYFQEYHSINNFKYSSIFSCFLCLFNYPIWTKIFNNNKKKKDDYIISILNLFKIKNKDVFEKYVEVFKKEHLKIIFENNDEFQEIKPLSFIKYNLAKLNEELNTINEENKRKYEIIMDDNLEKEIYTNYTEKYKSNINSGIFDNFFGTLELKRKCKRCNVNNYNFNYFYYLSFNMDYLISKGNDLNHFGPLIYNTIKSFYCDNCERETNHEENIVIYEAPKNLIFFFDKRNNNSNQIIFDEIITFKSSKSSNEEIPYYLYSILCQITNVDNDTIYISFTKEENESHNNNSQSYNLNQIKDEKNNFDIIGLFYYSDKQKKQNDYIVEQNNYKINVSQQSKLLLSKYNVNIMNNDLNEGSNEVFLNMTTTNVDKVFVNKKKEIQNSNNNNNIIINNNQINLVNQFSETNIREFSNNNNNYRINNINQHNQYNLSNDNNNNKLDINNPIYFLNINNNNNNFSGHQNNNNYNNNKNFNDISNPYLKEFLINNSNFYNHNCNKNNINHNYNNPNIKNNNPYNNNNMNFNQNNNNSNYISPFFNYNNLNCNNNNPNYNQNNVDQNYNNPYNNNNPIINQNNGGPGSNHNNNPYNNFINNIFIPKFNENNY